MRPAPVANMYVGLGGGYVHHTGYQGWAAVEHWRRGFKAYGGFHLFERVKLELTFYHFGRASFPGLGGPTTETSNAVSPTILLATPPLSSWLIATPFPTRLFGRLGAAVKHIEQDSLLGNTGHTGFSYVLGGGVEVDLLPSIFGRVEYDYVSKLLSGVNNVVDVQHTLVSVSLGARF